MNYKTIRNDGIFEEEIKRSRSTCQLKRVDTEEEGRQFIAQIKKEHCKATHSCSAMAIDEHAEIKHSSDDGEPSGTAGVPMLTVLEKQGSTNVVAVATRYLGGIKLGAGGPTRAYSSSVANALKEIGLIEVKEQEGLKITLSYPQYQAFINFLQAENPQKFDTEFLESITTYIYLDPDNVKEVNGRLVEFYQGKVDLTKSDSKIVEVPL